MDPLSATASIVAVLGAVEVARKGLSKLIALNTVPDIVLAIHNEVQDLHLTLRELEALAVEQGGDGRTRDFLRANVLPNAQRAGETLQELEGLLEYRIKKADGSISKTAWLRNEEQVRKLQKDLRHARLAISTALNLLNTATITRLETRLEALQLVTEQRHDTAAQSMVDQARTLERALLDVANAHKQSHARLANLEDLILTGRRSSTDSQASSSSANTNWSDSDTIVPTDTATSTSDFSSLKLRFLQRRKCNPYCSCVCHRTTRFNTPRSLQFLVGALFVGYSSVPRLTPSCSTPKCYGSQGGFVSVNYYFPRWILSRVLATAIHFMNHRGPEMSLSTMHLRDSTDLIFAAAAEGDAITVRRLLEDGHASVVDVASGTGHTPLHLAVIRSHVEVIATLLQYGAEPLIENATQEAPYDMAWSTVLCFEDTPNSKAFRVDEIKSLFPSTAALEERRTFSRVHQIVLKLIHLDLETELIARPFELDITDSDGRTALHWAAGRGDVRSTALLLKYGANPDHSDRIGQGPLRSSMKAADPDCMKLLINYGANVMQTDHWDQTCLQAAMYYSDPVNFALPLIQAGVDINAQDSTKTYALLEAVRQKHHDAIDMLLGYGADVNIQDFSGMTPLLTAVHGNDHVAARSLVRRRTFDATAKDNRGRNILHYAAEHADLPMLRLLAAAELEDVDVRIVQRDGLSAIEIAERRWKHALQNQCADEKNEKSALNEGWIKAFTLLLDSVLKRATVVIPPFKDEEDQSTDYTQSPADSIYFDVM